MLNNKISKAVRLAIAFGAASTAVFSASSIAAEKVEKNVERIEITGSAIKRTDMEGALPVQVISREDIEKTGVTSVTDLIQQLPAMQGFTTPSDSVGGGGGGISTASIHDIGAQYTLVLLNGRRLAPSDSGGTIDLNSIPLSAIKRVEVLTDGASALYGSDAIAGVVNFILKDEQDVTHLTVRADKPQEDGGSGWNLSLSTGFGNLDRDGYSVVVSYSHDEQEQLASKDREFAKTGIFNFEHEGRNLYYFAGSGNAIPGNARVTYLDDETGEEKRLAFNPYSQKTGACAANTSAINDECWFDYTSTIEVVPENQRDSVFVNAKVNFSDDITGFLTTAITKNVMTSRIAPYPTGWFNLPSDSDLVKGEVLPYLPDSLSDAEKASVSAVQGRWRALPAGNRTTEYDATSIHFVTGLTGMIDELDWEGSLTYSQNKQDQNYPEGWLIREPFVKAVGSGAINVFVPADELDDASKDALAKTVYHGNWSTQKVTLTGLDFKISTPIFELPAGEAYLASGLDYRKYNYENSIAEANANEELLFLSSGTAYDLNRDAQGLFVEVAMPVFEGFELNAALRYDRFSAVNDASSGDVNKSDSAVTYKLSARWQATEDLLVRASTGTGFKAPSMLSLARPRVDFGVTGGNYDCPFPSSDPLAAFCLSGSSQYNVFAQGNPNLKSETSNQYTIGFVYAPSNEFSFQMDYWNIDMEDLVTSLTEKQIFDNAERYRDLFTTKKNLATGEDELAIVQASVNVGKSKTTGLDWNMAIMNEFSFGTLRSNWSGTYMIKNEYTRPGTTDDWISSMGRFGDNNSVTFRLIQQLQTSLEVGDFEHTLRLNYKSGYQDQFQDTGSCAVTLEDAFGDCVEIQLNVPSYSLVDYQSVYNITDMASVSFGINNLFDKQPALSLRSGGAGHQVGYDPRYTDSYGRTFYLQADYRF